MTIGLPISREPIFFLDRFKSERAFDIVKEKPAVNLKPELIRRIPILGKAVARVLD